MPKTTFHCARITGIATCVPPTERRIDDDIELLGGNQAQIDRIKRDIGLDRRRVADPGVTALDLCEQAARDLLTGLGQPVEGIDTVIFVTQTPDHFQPCNAALLHGRLGLSEETAAFDVGLGCSGYVYGLWLAHSLIAAGGSARVLLLAGDTLTRCVHPRDRSVAPLFGDAGTATLVERAEGTASHFSLKTNGRGAGHIVIPAGAFREPPSAEAAVEFTDAGGNTRSRLSLAMNGGEVFNFSIKVEPPAVQEILDLAGTDAGAVDYFVFHQANRYIIGNIARRLKLPAAKVPSDTVSRYGNQSSASIPATICDACAAGLREAEKTLVVSGFGVGLSWATGLIRLGPLRHCALNDYRGTPPA